MPGQSTLGGFLNSVQIAVSAQQLLNLIASPIQLCAPSGPNQAVLLRSLIASLEFKSTPYTAPFGSSAAVYFAGPSRYPVTGLGYLNGPSWGMGTPQTNGPAFAATAVGGAVGGATAYTCNLRGASTNLFAGYYVDASEFVHGANSGRFLCVSNTATSIVLANASGVVDAGGQLIIEFPQSVWGAGGIGGPNDIAPLLTQSLVSCVYEMPIPSPIFPTSEISGCPIVLANGLPLLGNPQNFTSGDSSLLLTLEYLQISL